MAHLSAHLTFRQNVPDVTHQPLSVLSLSKYLRYRKQQQTFKLASYRLKMASFNEHLDRVTWQASLVLLGNDCKYLHIYNMFTAFPL